MLQSGVMVTPHWLSRKSLLFSLMRTLESRQEMASLDSLSDFEGDVCLQGRRILRAGRRRWCNLQRVAFTERDPDAPTRTYQKPQQVAKVKSLWLDRTM